MIGAANYLPILHLRKAEIPAYEMLSNVDKDRIFPLIALQKWHHKQPLSASLAKIAQMVGDRRFACDIIKPLNPIHEPDLELAALTAPHDGYTAWRAFVSKNQNIVPVLQRHGGKRADIRLQAEGLLEIRGDLIVRIRRDNKWRLNDLRALKDLPLTRDNFLLVADYGQLDMRTDVNIAAAETLAAVEKFVAMVGLQDANVAFSSSSFPGGFKDIHPERERLEIRERQFHRVLANSGLSQRLNFRSIYSDRASVHAGSRGGGGQGPAPRVDYPTSGYWVYERREVDAIDPERADKESCYVNAANAILACDDWADDLIIWGSQEIRRAAGMSLSMLDSPQRWTSVRINIHLHRQTNFDDASSPEQHEDEWVD
jgi:hypothetical protein